MPSYMGVDRATPPSATELATLKNRGVRWIGGYVGGVNNGGRDWHPAHIAACRLAGFRVLPIYVGQNVCASCDSSRLTPQQGQIDGGEAVVCARDFGCAGGPLCLDIEYSTWTQANPQSVIEYVNAWVEAVSAGGYHPVIYGPVGMVLRSDLSNTAGYWLADWDGTGDLAHFPNADHYAGIGWQYADNWFGFDASHADGLWWGGLVDMPGTVSGFATGFSIGGGFAQCWQHHGGLVAFGMPISGEFDTTDEHGPVRLQYFERAIFEWRSGQYPDNWDVSIVLLGSLVASNPDKLGWYHTQRMTHDPAFTPPS